MNERDALLFATQASEADLAALRRVMLSSGLSDATVSELIFIEVAPPGGAARVPAPRAGLLDVCVDRCCSAIGIAGAASVGTIILAVTMARSLENMVTVGSAMLPARRRARAASGTFWC